MTNGFDIVSIGIRNEGAVIITMIMRPQSRLPIILSAGSYCRGVERIHETSILAGEGNMSAGLRNISHVDPKEGLLTDPGANEIYALRVETYDAKRA